jgi:hypothetical protein
MKKQIFVTDIGLASILDAYGIPKRQPDCITREVRERDGKNVETGKWWYDVTDGEHETLARDLINAYSKARYWEEFTLDIEHPIYWMKGVLENRTANLHLYHNGATPMQVIESGDKTILIGPRLSQQHKDLLKKAL